MKKESATQRLQRIWAERSAADQLTSKMPVKVYTREELEAYASSRGLKVSPNATGGQDEPVSDQ